MEGSNMNNLKNFCLTQEIFICIDQVKRCLAELQSLKHNIENHFATLQFLSTGIERILKYSICYAYKGKKDEFPNFREQNLITHDASTLLNKFITEYFTTNNIPAINSDYEFLTSDKELKQIMEMLSKFGDSSRYFNFDVVNNKNGTEDIIDIWNNMIKNFIESNQYLYEEYFYKYNSGYVDREVAKHFVIIMEKLLRAILRQFNLGIESEVSRDDGSYHHFLCLSDNELGKTDYYKEIYS